MNKKSVLSLILFSCIVIAGMFLGTMIMIRQPAEQNYSQNQQENNSGDDKEDKIIEKVHGDNSDYNQDQSIGVITEGDWDYTGATNDNLPDYNGVEQNENQSVSSEEVMIDNRNLTEENTIQSETTNPTDTDESENSDNHGEEGTEASVFDTDSTNSQGETETEVTFSGNIIELPDMQLITDSNQVDYMRYIPEMVYDSKIEVALDIANPLLDIKAKSAILFDVKTRKVLYYKDPILPIFPASTAKLLTALVALDWCMEEEEVRVGDELDLVAYDSTIARLKKGQVLTIRNLIEGMLVPSGNDAAYVTAAYVGRKSLKNDNASLKDAIPEFIRLMNNKAKSLGVINSCFKTPDGYDAIGQYTTAYDMGLIGLAAAENETILEVCNKSRARNVFIDGFDVTWNNTNSLIKKDSGRYYPYCIGLKTGTSTMAGRCLISLAKKGDREVIAVVMNSNSEGRWEDSKKLLDYGLGN